MTRVTPKPLSVEIRRGKKVIDRISLPDPRKRFCETFNRINEDGLTAHPAKTK